MSYCYRVLSPPNLHPHVRCQNLMSRHIGLAGGLVASMVQDCILSLLLYRHALPPNQASLARLGLWDAVQGSFRFPFSK